MAEHPILFTIGFTQKSAEEFFGKLVDAGVRRVLDVRLRNNSQLSGFAKGRDLNYFLKQLGNIDYHHVEMLAPSSELLDGYKKAKGTWEDFEVGFQSLLEERLAKLDLSPEFLKGACLLCSEHEADHCHRRLVAERLVAQFPDLQIVHL